MQHMSKCFQAIGKLKLDSEAPGNHRPKALGMVSCVGEETVTFKTPLPLEGKARVCGGGLLVRSLTTARHHGEP